jgi:hypothetical protein
MKYQNGYLPKIAYHMANENQAKVNYFFNRQVEAYGPITAGDMTFIIQKRDSILRNWAIEEGEFNSHLNVISL